MYKSFEKEAKILLQDLEKYNDEPFVKRPDVDQWSMGELYNHLLLAGNWQIAMVNKCIAKDGGRDGGSKTFAGLWVFQFGSILGKQKNVSIKKKYPPEIPKKVADVKDKLLKLIKDMNIMNSEVISLEKKQLKYTVKHPRFGELNAHDWYRFSQIHFKHHRSQKKRIEEFLIKRSSKS